MPSRDETTELLIAWSGGDRAAGDELAPRIYGELRALARRRLAGERADHTLSPTEVVHEVFLRLFDQDRIPWTGRAHFFTVAARTMRRILVDHARRRGRGKRGGGSKPAPLASLGDLAPAPGAAHDADTLLDLDRALGRLERFDARKVRVVELHFFAGLSVDETADVIGCSRTTVTRDWRLAKAWLQEALDPGAADETELSGAVATAGGAP
ncbi:MAG: ECF-type sigma factor [Acidobacteriota bacterium]